MLRNIKHQHLRLKMVLEVEESNCSKRRATNPLYCCYQHLVSRRAIEQGMTEEEAECIAKEEPWQWQSETLKQGPCWPMGR